MTARREETGGICPSETAATGEVKARRSCREALVDGQETADFIKVNEDL